MGIKIITEDQVGAEEVVTPEAIEEGDEDTAPEEIEDLA